MTNYSQPGIINALDYGLVANDPSAASANVTALLDAIIAAQATCATSPGSQYGGTVIIPSNDLVPSGTGTGDGAMYFFGVSSGGSGPAITITCQYPILILGTGGATWLVMTTDNDLFDVDNNVGKETGAEGGVAFQDLKITYQTGLTSGAAIRVSGGSQNVRLFRVVLKDCPVGLALDESLQCSMIDCVVWNQTNGGDAVTLGTSTSDNTAKETYIAGCLLESSLNTGTGLTIVNSDEVRVESLRIQGYAQGVAIVPEVGYCVHLYFDDVVAIPDTMTSSSAGGAALLIQPSNTGSVVQAVFVGCVFGQTENPTAYTGPGVFVDQSQTSGVVDQVRFVSCWSSAWPGNGMQINAAVTQLEIIGGCYSCNGRSSEGGTPTVGIDITSPASGTQAGTRIIGAACNNSVYDNEGNGYLSATQDFGILIGSGAENVFISKCDLTRNNTAGLQAANPDATVQVTDCAGYNDRATSLATSPPANGVTFYPFTYENYAGPAAFYVSGGSGVAVAINGVSTGLTQGGFTLGRGESAALSYGATAPEFYMVGK